MRKYWMIFRVELENTMAFRGAAMVWVIFDLIWIVVFPFVWLAVARASGDTVAGWNPIMIVTYFVFLALLSNLIFMHPEVHVGNEIYEGKFTNYLIKPQNYIMQAFLQQLSWKVVRATLFIPMLVVIVIPFRALIDFSVATNPWFLIMAIILAIPIYFFSALIVAFLAFWFEEPWPARSLFWVATGLFGGMYAPMEFMPAAVQKIAALLPFKYAIYFPLRLFIGKLGQADVVQGFLGQIIWFVILMLLIALMWRKGLRKYSAIGR